MHTRRYTVLEPARYRWLDWGEPDPEDVVVYDHRLGLTHRVDATAMAVHRHLVEVRTAHHTGDAGLTPEELARHLHPCSTADGSPQASGVHSTVLALLQAMAEAGLIQVVDEAGDHMVDHTTISQTGAGTTPEPVPRCR